MLPALGPQSRNIVFPVPDNSPQIRGCQSPNPLIKMAAGAAKVRTLCSKWQLECQKYEPCAQNGSWSAQSTNRSLKILDNVKI